jgi:large repetitive protein
MTDSRKTDTAKTPKSAANKSRRNNRNGHLIALEPRMMFDGAGVATAAATMIENATGAENALPKNLVSGIWADGNAEKSLASIGPASPKSDNNGPSHIRIDRETNKTEAIVQTDNPASPNRPSSLDPFGENTLNDQQFDRSFLPERLTQQAFIDFGQDPVASGKNFIFIDSNVNGYQDLAAEWAGKGTVILIDGGRDGIDQIRAALAGQNDIDAIHIVSHGSDGAFFLGTTRIDEASVSTSLSSSFAAIGSKLSGNGDILIYGCDVGNGAGGQGLLNALAITTGADIAASIDDTGSILRGGNWILENKLGTVENAVLEAQNWQGLLAPAIISINPATTVLSVFDSTGALVARSGTIGTGFSGGTSVGVSAGGFAVWANAGTVSGQAVDLRAVIVSATNGSTSADRIRFNQPSATSNDPGFLLQTSGATGTASVQVRWELVLAGTNTPIAADISFTIADIDGTGANPAIPTREAVVVSTDSLSSFQSAAVTDIRFNTGVPGVVSAFGTVNELASPPTAISAARFNWTNTSSWVITYNLERAGSTQAGFNHDGNNEFAFGTGGVTTSIPRLDLDGNNSTAPGANAVRNYIENGAAVSITDADPAVTNPIGIIQNATITLTNAQLGDVLAVGALTGGLTSTVDTSVAGQVKINITGPATAAQYAAAFQAITYRNTTERPSSTDRNVTVSYSNGTFSSNLAVSTIRVTEINDAPTAANDGALTTAEDTPIVGINVLGNDRDGEAVSPTTGDPLTVTAATAANGTVVIGAGGLLTYTPNANFNGTDTINYTISDGRGGTSSAIVPITITAVNDAPVPVGALPPRANVDAAAGINVATASAFADVDGPALTYSASGLPAGLSINAATGVITGTIDRSASQTGGGVYNVAVSASDGTNSAVQNFSWTITNPAPIAANDTALVIAEDFSGTTINVLANDVDPDGDPITVVSASATKGSVIINANGTITYTPNANYNGADTITYTISDGQGGTSTATIPVTVNPINDAPTKVGTLPPRTNVDAAAGISVPTASAFADIDGPALTYSATGLPAGLSINAATGVISGTINRSASQTGGGVYNIVITASDGSAAATQSFTWTVTNPAPAAANDTAATNEDTPIASINVLGNDSDPDGDPLAVTAASAPNGTVTINPDGTLRYVPNANFNGTDTITYTISDGQGGTSTATVTVTVAAVNDAPTPLGALPPRNNVDAAAGINVPTAQGFADADSAVLTYSIDPATPLPAGLSINAATGVISGSIDRAASQGGTGGVYTINVRASDGVNAPAVQSFTWTITNPAPIAGNDTGSTAEDTPILIPVLPNDSDPDGDTLSLISAFTAVGQATIVGNQIQYTPPANFNGSAVITYTISDGNGGTSTATVTVTISPVNDTPTAAPIAPRNAADGAAIAVPVAGSFTDPDGDPLTFSAAGLPAGLTIDPVTGLISGTIDKGASQINGGVYTATITASDGKGGTISQTIAFNISNPAPVAANDTSTTAEDTPVTIPVLANDSDPDGDPLTVTSAAALNGTVIIGANGEVTYTPNPGFNGTDTITYEISDGNGGTSTATVTITVTDVNDVPTSGAIANQTNLDSQIISLPVGAAFSDPDGDILSYSAAGLPAGLTINAATGVISGTIDNSASQANGGQYAVTITASDGRGGNAVSTFNWSVSNPAPTAANDAITITEDSIANIPVLANDVDLDGDPLTVTSATAGNGTVTINPDGSLVYTPNPNFNGEDTIIYRVTDSEGGVSTATVTVTVTPVNDAPTTVGIPNQNGDDGATISLNIASSFSDLDGDALTFSATNLPPNLTIDPATGLISGTLAPETSANGPYVVSVTAIDPSGRSITTNFVWSVQNIPPVAVNDVATTTEDTPVTVGVLTNDSDPDGDPLTITSASATNGSVVINANGTVTFTPNPDFNGIAVVSYTISDGNGGNSTATLTVNVGAANDGPSSLPLPNLANQDSDAASVNIGDFFSDKDGDALSFSASGLPAGLGIDPASGIISGTIGRGASQPNGGVYTVTITATDPGGLVTARTFSWAITNPAPTASNDNVTTAEDTPATINVLANDNDPDGDPLTISSAVASNGVVTINADGTLSYTPNANFNGTDTIIYVISDGNGGTSTAAVTVTVTPVNDAPVAADDTASTNEDTPVTIGILSNDSDVDGDPLSILSANSPNGTVVINPDGTITFTPNANFNGTTSITYTISDGKGGTSTATVSVTVDPVNDAPVANPSAATTPEDTPVTVPVLANDSDPDGDPLTVTAASAPNGTVAINADGTVTYTPNANFNGSDTITYTISDGNGGFAVSSVTVTVSPVNDRPVASPIAPQTNNDAGSVNLPIAGNFSDVDNDPLTFSAAGLPPGLSINAAGVITGTISPNASQGGPNGDGIYAVTITASDGKGGTITQTISWTVNNPPPVAVNDTANTGEDTPVTIPVLSNDSDPDGDPLTVTSAAAPNGAVIINADGTVTYTPNANFNGTDTITYTISDGNGGTATATVTVTVNAVNDAPVADAPIAAQINVDSAPVNLPVAGNFSDLDGDILTFTATGLPAGLAISADGTISGTLDKSASQGGPNGDGIYTISVTANDGKGGTVTSSFTWTVTNPAPVAADDTTTTTEDTPVTIAPLSNDSDPDGDPLTITSAAAPNGTVTVNANGTITYTPNANFNGTDTITYTISDGNGGTATATITVAVNADNDPPVADNPLPNRANADSDVANIDISGNFSDLDGDTITFAATGLPAGVTIDPDTGILSGTIDPGASQINGGVYTVTITAADGNGGTVSSVFTWAITNPVLTAIDDSATVDEDTASAPIRVLDNDSDPDGDPITVVNASAANGTVAINADGTLTYTPNPNFNGTDTISYTISDGNGGSSTAAVVVTVVPVNDAPTADPPLVSQSNADAQNVSVDVSGSFADLDGDTLSFSASGLPLGLSIDPVTGIISGTIDRGASQPNDGIYAVTITANDGNGGTVSSTFTWTVTNPAPAASNDSAATNEDAPITILPLSNDIDPDGDAISITDAAANNGTVVINADGSITYTPNANFNGTDSIVYSISDGNGGTATATIAVTVAAVNDAPISAGLPNLFDSNSETLTVDLAPAFSDPDGNLLTFSATGLPPGLSINPANGVVTGTVSPTASSGGPNGDGSYIVSVTAADGTERVVTNFIWQISNQPPLAQDDAYVTDEDTPIVFDVRTNDIDPDSDPATPIQIVSASANNGNVIINTDGTMRFVPDADFTGTATVTYVISDGLGGFSSATATINIVAVNDAPDVTPIPDQANQDGNVVSLSAGALFTDREGEPLTFDDGGTLPTGLSIDASTGQISGTIDANASQPNGGVYSVTITATDASGASTDVSFIWTVTNPAPTAADDSAITSEDTQSAPIIVLGNDTDPDGDTLTVTSATAPNGTVIITPAGALLYTPNANFNGTDTISYTISDGQGGTATAIVVVTVNPANDVPVATPLPARSNLDSESFTLDVSGSFSDGDGDVLTFTDNGTLPLGLSIDPATGVIGGVFDPSSSQGGPNADGVYTVTITASDGKGGAVSQTFSWTVTNPPPIAVSGVAQTNEDTPVAIDVLGNDSDPDGDPLTIVSGSAGNGTVTIDPITNELTYTPNPDFNGSDTITYTISDGNGGFSSATVEVNVIPQNDAPVSSAIAPRGNVDSAVVSFPVAGSFSDIDDAALAFSISGAPEGITIDPDSGVISGTLLNDASQQNGGAYSVTVTATDEAGAVTSQTFTWTINNPAPIAANDTASTDEDTQVIIDVTANDSDPDGDPIRVTLASAGNGNVVINPDGTIAYTPNANFNGTDTITYTISDGNGGTATATVAVIVAPRNDPPVAANDTASTVEDTPVTLAVLPNDSDLDGDSLTVTNATAANGTVAVNADGTITYTPNPDFNGTDTVTYTISDGNGGTATATATILVGAVNDAPVAQNDSGTTSEDTPVTINILGNDSDVDGDPLLVTSATSPDGIVSINPDGSITFKPNPNFNGTASIAYTISDGKGGTAQATVSVTVTPVNDPPVAVNDNAQTSEDTPVTIAVLSNDRDADNDALTVTAATAGNGTVVINPDGTLRYTPNANFNGVDTVTYTISDGNGGTSIANVTIDVGTGNDAPVGTAIPGQASADSTAIALQVAGNFSDVDGDPLTFSATGLPAGLSIDSMTGIISGTIAKDASIQSGGIYSVTVTVSDGKGGAASQSFTWAVTNPAPVAVIDTAATTEDVPVVIAILANDSDTDGDPLSILSAAAPNGSVTVNPDGTVTYTPNPNFNGTDTITYTISDGNGGTATATATVTVAPVNDAPVAVNDSAQTSEDTPVTIPILPNDSDADGDVLTVTSASAANGAVTIGPDGSVTYTPNANFYGTDTVTYTISDGNGGTATATVLVIVNPANDIPAGTPITNQTDLDSDTVSLNIASNFSDADGDVLTYAATGLPAGLSIDPATGIISGTIDRAASQPAGGVYSVIVTASDGKGGLTQQAFSWTVSNPAPTATNDTAATTEDTPVTISVLSDDNDPDGDALQVTSASAPNGVVSINADGTITYTPNANFSGTDIITYTISDGNGGTATATATITVTPQNDPPVATNDNRQIAEDSPITIAVLSNDSDSDGDPLSVTTAAAPNGTVIINPDGTLTYTPNANFNGVDTITYTISDGKGGTDTATVTIGVGIVNDAPVAAAIAGQSNVDGAVIALNVANSFTDSDGDPLTFSAAGLPAGLSIDPATGIITGTVNNQASQNAAGAYSVSITAVDGKGGAATQNFVWTITNPAPVAANDAASTNEDTPVTIAVLGNDSDPDGDPLRITSASAANGVVSVNPDGTITYTPNANFGGTDTITYMISDGNGGTATANVTVTVSPLNDPPVAANDGATTLEDTPVIITVLNNDSDVDGDALRVTSATAPNGLVRINADGTITYSPNVNFNGTDIITYTITDGKGGTSTATVTIEVAAVNDVPAATIIPDQDNLDSAVIALPIAPNFADSEGDALSFTASGLPAGLSIDAATGLISGTIDKSASQLAGGVYSVVVTGTDIKGSSFSTSFTWTVSNPAPEALDDAASTTEDQPVTINVLSNDNDPDGDPLQVTSASAANGTAVINADGSITYTPRANFNGADTITYTISDGNGGTSTATVAIDVAPANDPPVAVNDTAATREDTPVRIAVIGNDSDLDNDPLAVVSASAANGSVTINPDGTITYTPNANFNGTDTVTYTITDGNGGTSTATVTITVAPVNDPPVAVNDIAATAEDQPVTISVLSNDSDADGDPLTVTAATSPNGTAIINPDGTITFTPGANFNGPATINYTISDGNGGTSNATVTVNVAPVNDPPVAKADTGTTLESTPVRLSPLGNDNDPDGDPLIITSANAPNGTVTINADGTVTYTPNANFSGIDVITYQISDGKGGTSIATIAVTVTPVNAAPIAVDDRIRMDENTSAIINILANDTDGDGDALTVTAASSPQGTVTINPDGTVRFTPRANFFGPATITYTISDGNGGVSSATVFIDVTNINAAPTDGNEIGSTFPGVPITANVLANASDVDGNPLTIFSAVVSDGSVIINANGTLTYTPPIGFSGPVVVRYILSDSNGGFVQSTWTIDVVGDATDIDALLGKKDAGRTDGWLVDGVRDQTAEFISTRLIVDDTANSFRSLRPTPDLNGERPLLTAINGLSWLKGTGELDVDGHAIDQVSGYIDRIRDVRFGSDRIFDPRYGDFIVKSLTGFSARLIVPGAEQILIDSVVRDGVIYVEFADIGTGADSPIEQFQLKMRDGGPLPEWIHMDKRGLAIIERPVDAETLRLVVRAVTLDGKILHVPILIQGATGEIQIDDKLTKAMTDKYGAADSLAKTMALASIGATTEAADLAAAFNDEK